jgi:hypothetical protein
VVIETYPDQQLSAIQGSDDSNQFEFQLDSKTEIGKPEIKSYLLRAVGKAGKASVKSEVTVYSGVAAVEVVSREVESFTEITSESLSGRLVEKFFAKRMDLHPQCDELHSVCLARLTFTLDEADNIDELHVFPQPPMVYNNALLYELIACAEDRLGQLPDLHVSDNGVEKLAVAYNLNFLDGLSVTKEGLSQANIKVQVDRGLKIADDKVALDLGQGLEISDSGVSENKLAANLGEGLKFNNKNEIAADLGKGLTHDVNNNNKIAANLGKGLVVSSDNKIEANLGKGLVFNVDKIEANVSIGSHKETHVDGGADKIEVDKLSGVMKDAQKVEVWKDGITKIGTRTVLNFKGNGVSVTDDNSVNPPRINIDIPGVSTGRVSFKNMGEGDVMTSPEISHGLETDLVAFVVGLEDAGGSILFFGDLGVFGAGSSTPALNLNPIDIPQLGVSCPGPTASPHKFVIRVQRNEHEGAPLVNYGVRWWAIAMTQPLGTVEVKGNPVPEPSSLDPHTDRGKTDPFDITILGEGFVTDSKVLWDGSEIKKTFFSETKLTVTFPPVFLDVNVTINLDDPDDPDDPDPGAFDPVEVTVVNPKPGGGVSPPPALIFQKMK